MVPQGIKPFYESKTLWTNLILAICSIFLPGVNGYVSIHPEVLAIFFAGINMVLRLVTKDKISLEAKV